MKRAIKLQRLQQRNAQPDSAVDKAAIQPVSREGQLPLTWAQRSLWFLDQLDQAAGAAYHMPVALRLRGQLNYAALRATLDRLISRHESLRTRFALVDGEPVQEIVPADAGFVLEEHDLSAMHEAQQSAAVVRLSQDEASRPFDLAQGPLIRGQLLTLSSQEWVLLITQHHIISDAWSSGIFVREVRELYTAFAQGKDDPLPPLAIQYADYAAWQRSWLQGEVLERQIAFWKKHLGGAPALLELPTDRPRPPQQSYAGSRIHFTLPAELSSGIRELGRVHGATLFMTLQAAFAVLMSRLSGQDDVVLGTSMSNRNMEEIESLIGFFVNMRALRVKLDDDPSIDALLERVKGVTLEAYAHQDLPFEQVVEALQPTRSMSYSPVFQVMLTMQNTPGGGELALPGLSLSVLEQEASTTHFDLSLTLRDLPSGIEGTFEYATDLFDRTTIERIAQHWQTLMAAMVADPGKSVSRLPMLTPADYRLLTKDLNATQRAYPSESLLHQLFEAQAALQPNVAAVVARGRQLSYSELNARANVLAHRLRTLGVQPDDRVAICAGRSLEMIVGILGILKAGGAYVPLDPDSPAERLAHMMADCRPRALLIEGSNAAALVADTIPVINLQDVDLSSCVDEQMQNLAVADLTAQHLAYVIYTSGSTGLPKGVMVEHGSAINFWDVLSQGIYLHCQAPLRVAMNASYFFDMSLKALLQLLSGHTVVLVPAEARASGAEMLQFIQHENIQALDCTPSQLELLLQAGLMNGAGKLQRVLIGGEALSAATWDLLSSTKSAIQFYNMYGPTECTVDATIGLINGAGTSRNIGQPVANTQIYILDAHLQPVPLGVTGELYIGGVQVARGYLNRPELTAQRFVADPFGAAGGRLYRTGDLARWRPEGVIEYLGRNDFQVKVRGFRIELGEIEARLAACDGVREAVVIAREDVAGDKRLVAYLLAQPGAVLAAAALREQLSQHLAEYMVPSAFVVLEAYPLTPNGKLDRKALPAPDQAAVATRAYAAPQGEIETAVAQIWQELLGLEQVGRHDHFFELGGHSLMTVQLVSRLRALFRVDLELREVFEHPTLIALSRVLSSAEHSTMTALMAVDRGDPLPLSWAQRSLWFLDQFDKAAGAAYRMPVSLRLKGRLDLAALQATLDRIMARHESLRTCFVVQDGEPVQVIAPANCGFALTQHDMSGLHDSEQEVAMARWNDEEAARPFDLACGPLIRGSLLKIAEDEFILSINYHHIISDGWSTGILVREVRTLYSAFVQGLPDPLAPLAIQYADYAAWQRGWLQGEVLERQLGYWKQHLGGAPALLELPTDRPRPAQQSYAGDRVHFTLPAVLTSGLRELSRAHGATLFMTLQAAFVVLMGRLSGQSDIVLGTSMANRRRAEVENLIGFFVNMRALRVKLDDDPDVNALLARVKADTLEAYAHQDLPFEQVVEALQPVRSMSYSPLFQVMLTMQNTPDGGPLVLPQLTLSPVEQKGSSTHFDLSLTLFDHPDQIEGVFDYATVLFDASTIERMAAQWRLLLTAMVADPAQRVSRLPVIDEQGLQQLLLEFNATERAYPVEQKVHQLFEEHAARQPGAVALVVGDVKLSYGELNARANQVAHRLLALGVGTDARVAICAERSVEMVVGLLGILKAGGAYVPLDPAYPVERLAYMLEDSAPVALLQYGWQAPAGLAMPVLALGDASTWSGYSADNPAVPVLSSQLAYVIYTSGSTGKPKGVMIEHAGLSNYLQWALADYCQLQGHSSIVSSPIAFDATITSLYLPLVSGNAVTLLRDGDEVSGLEALLRTQQHWGLVKITPAHLAMLGQSLRDHGAPCDVGLFVVGGEALPMSTVALWREICPQARIVNEYGPTETVVGCITHDAPPVANDERDVPIGRPIGNTQIYILDAHMQPVPVGVTGEIYIGGAGVARGYLNRPELTAQRFIADPFGAAGGRLYRTGDLARWRPEGVIEYLGRNDFQVKVRGFRIELGEIEARLAACDGVREAVVIAREDVAGDKRLVAYLLAQPGAVLAAAALREQLLQHLAEYMVPSAFVVLEAYPLTPNGKLDRKALPVPDQAAVATRAYAAPQGEIETAVARIWQELLGLEQVGRHDHFFELGGHSLLAVQMMSRLRQMLRINAALRELFIHPVLVDFVKAISVRGDDHQGNVAAIRTTGSQAPLFFVHPAGGQVDAARRLAAVLDAEIPVYGLVATGLEAGELPLSSVEDMAARYLGEIRKVQPQGPYRLAGWSAGGMIAYEIANQLVSLDETVEYLGLIDTPNNGGSGLVQPKAEPGVDDTVVLLLWLLREWPELEVLRPLAAVGNASQFLRECQIKELFVADIDTATFLRHLRVWQSTSQAVQQYVPAPLSAPLTLFIAKEVVRTDETLGWGELMGARLRRIPANGNHLSIMDSPHIAELGRAMSEQLNAGGDPTPPPERAYSPRVIIQKGTVGKSPVFCIPGAGASVTSFCALAEALGNAIPVIGLQPRGLCGILAPYGDVETAADANLRAMWEQQPEGPYHLVGHSFGGWVALEMARRLLAEGAEVSTLMLIDSTPPPDNGLSDRRFTRVQGLLRLTELFELSVGKPLGVAEGDFTGLSGDAQIALLLSKTIASGLVPPKTTLQTLKGVFRAFMAALNTRYEPASAYSGALQLVLAESPRHSCLPEGAISAFARWRRYAPRAAMLESAGNHVTVLHSRNVAELADWIHATLLEPSK
nr:non-ribosomal peptide synthetase [Duganella lactea]